MVARSRRAILTIFTAMLAALMLLACGWRIVHLWAEPEQTPINATLYDELRDSYISSTGHVFITITATIGDQGKQSLEEVIKDSSLRRRFGLPNDAISREVYVNSNLQKWQNVQLGGNAVAVWVYINHSGHQKEYVYRRFDGSYYCTRQRDIAAEGNDKFCVWGKLLPKIEN